jgi:hypothetical protein
MQAICALLSVFGFVLHQVRSWLNAQVWSLWLVWALVKFSMHLVSWCLLESCACKLVYPVVVRSFM